MVSYRRPPIRANPVLGALLIPILRKNLNAASKPSELPGVFVKTKTFIGGNIGCMDEYCSWHVNIVTDLYAV